MTILFKDILQERTRGRKVSRYTEALKKLSSKSLILFITQLKEERLSSIIIVYIRSQIEVRQLSRREWTY